jgi:hypothetical protein
MIISRDNFLSDGFDFAPAFCLYVEFREIIVFLVTDPSEEIILFAHWGERKAFSHRGFPFIIAQVYPSYIMFWHFIIAFLVDYLPFNDVACFLPELFCRIRFNFRKASFIFVCYCSNLVHSFFILSFILQ